VRQKQSTIELSAAGVEQTRQQIWASITRSDEAGKAAYADLVALLGHPASTHRLRMIAGGKRLHRLLYVVILMQRLGWLAVVGGIVVTIFVSWWALIAIPFVILLYLILNSRQTHLNVEITARLYQLHKLMEEDPRLRMTP
jgi:hypothetical protein